MAGRARARSLARLEADLWERLDGASDRDFVQLSKEIRLVREARAAEKAAKGHGEVSALSAFEQARLARRGRDAG